MRASDAARAVSLYVDFPDLGGTAVWIESEVKKSKTAMGSRASALALAGAVRRVPPRLGC